MPDPGGGLEFKKGNRMQGWGPGRRFEPGWVAEVGDTGRPAGASSCGRVPAGTKAELWPSDRAFLRGVGFGWAHGERTRGGSLGFGHHPCRVLTYRYQASELPWLPAFLAPGTRK